MFCSILGGHLIGPTMFDETLIGQRYLEILQTCLEDLIDNLPLADRIGHTLYHVSVSYHQVLLQLYMMQN